LNIAENAEAMAAGTREGWEPTAWDGIQQSIDLLVQKHIKVIINGGALNPHGLAQKRQQLVSSILFAARFLAHESFVGA
jgi:Acyclic terpene utilisation family protein AtuA